jgi:hypothetical protein
MVFAATVVVPFEAQARIPSLPIALVVGIAVGAVMCAWSNRMIRRFVGRLVPLRASGKRRPIAAGVCAGVALASSGAIGLWAPLLLKPPSPNSGSAGMDFFTVVPGFAFATAFGSLAFDYYRGRPRPAAYVLYLRSFLSFSDRAMMALIFSLIAARRRVIVLTAPRSDAASWDPILIAFRGNPLLTLRAKVPLFMTASDADWQVSVKRLIEGASHTIVDVSALTPGVQTELEMLRDTPRSGTVLWLCEKSRVEVLEKVRRLVGTSTIPAERVVFYYRSAMAALSGISAGFGLSFLFLFLAPAVADLKSGRMPTSTLFVPYFVAVFLQPAVDRQARRELRALLSDVRG